MSKPHVIILGAGPAGLGAAFQLTRREIARVTVLEQNKNVGGNAGSFEISGLNVDYGSHRLHPACDPQILKDIQELLGSDLLDRERHGRIRLRGRWIHFPLKPLNLGFNLPPSFSFGTATDLMGKFCKRKPNPQSEESFSSILEAGLGRTICREFYFPYARKIWGLPPEDLSATQAYRRVSANSLGKMFKKILSAMPGIKRSGGKRFFYPRMGFGQISELLYQAARDAGAEFLLNARLKFIKMNGDNIISVCFEKEGEIIAYPADYVWSTIPLPSLVRYIKPSAPPLIIEASKGMEYRAMILVYLLLEQDHFSEYDAHYFPEIDIPITRLSEPKNYCNVKEPKGRTVLCAEIPCSTNDPEWHMTDETLGKRVCYCLELAGIPIKAPIKEIITRRLSKAYPIYRKGYNAYLDRIDQWIGQVKNLLTFGRQGLFVHDNTHHALYMAYSAVRCFNSNGNFDRSQWQDSRKVFNSLIVED